MRNVFVDNIPILLIVFLVSGCVVFPSELPFPVKVDPRRSEVVEPITGLIGTIKPMDGRDGKGYIITKVSKSCKDLGFALNSGFEVDSGQLIFLSPVLVNKCPDHYRHRVKIEVLCQSSSMAVPLAYQRRSVYWFFKGKQGVVQTDQSGMAVMSFVTVENIQLEDDLRFSLSDDKNQSQRSHPRLLFNKDTCS